jgi:hypothetical protein
MMPHTSSQQDPSACRPCTGATFLTVCTFRDSPSAGASDDATAAPAIVLNILRSMILIPR